MKYPKSDKGIRMFCLELASNGLSTQGVDMDKAKEYYEFITSSSKPSVWRRLVLAWSHCCATLLQLFHRR